MNEYWIEQYQLLNRDLREVKAERDALQLRVKELDAQWHQLKSSLRNVDECMGIYGVRRDEFLLDKQKLEAESAALRVLLAEALMLFDNGYTCRNVEEWIEKARSAFKKPE